MATKDKLLDGTAPFTEPAAENNNESSSVEAKIKRDQSTLKPSVPEEPRQQRPSRAHSSPHEHHQRYGHRGDGDDDERLSGRKLLTRHLCARYRVSDRTIDRWVADPRLGFPQPLIVNNRRYWEESEIVAFDARQREAAA